MNLKIHITSNSQTVECAGHPLALLMELTTFCARQEQLSHLLKHAVKLAEVAEAYVKDGKETIDVFSKEHDEGTKIIEDFMKRYESFSYKKD
jgi:hypothetical protein